MEEALVIHHWDTDGICSAAQILEFLEYCGFRVTLFTPIVGCYWLDSRELEELLGGGYDLVCVADISLPWENLRSLRGVYGRVFVFDHHKVKGVVEGVSYINPYLGGLERMYPSTSWIIKEFLGRDTDLLAVLGAIGDNEWRIRVFPMYSEITGFLGRFSLGFRDVLEMVYLLDSNYKVNDRGAVVEAVSRVLKYKNNPKTLLESRDWRVRMEMVEGEVNRWVNASRRVVGRAVLLEIHTKLNIISAITRRVAWSNPGRVTVVVNKGYFRDQDQIYFREYYAGVDLSWIIELAKSRGYLSGGRGDAVGVIIPKSDLEGFLSYVLNRLARC